MATARQLLGQGIGVGFGMGAGMSGTRVAFTEKTRDHYEDSNSSRMCWRSRTSYDNDELFRTTQLSYFSVDRKKGPASALNASSLAGRRGTSLAKMAF